MQRVCGETIPTIMSLQKCCCSLTPGVSNEGNSCAAIWPMRSMTFSSMRYNYYKLGTFHYLPTPILGKQYILFLLLLTKIHFCQSVTIATSISKCLLCVQEWRLLGIVANNSFTASENSTVSPVTDNYKTLVHLYQQLDYLPDYWEAKSSLVLVTSQARKRDNNS